MLFRADASAPMMKGRPKGRLTADALLLPKGRPKGGSITISLVFISIVASVFVLILLPLYQIGDAALGLEREEDNVRNSQLTFGNWSLGQGLLTSRTGLVEAGLLGTRLLTGRFFDEESTGVANATEDGDISSDTSAENPENIKTPKEGLGALAGRESSALSIDSINSINSINSHSEHLTSQVSPVSPSAAADDVTGEDMTLSESHAAAVTCPHGSWPKHLFGETVSGPFIRPFTFKIADSCKGLPGGDKSAQPVIGGSPITPEEAAKEVERALLARAGNASKEESGNAALHAILLIPVGGIGNNLLGAVIALAYGIISGRRVLRYHWGADKHIFDGLCIAFRCNTLEFPPVGNPYQVATRLFNIKGEQWNASLEGLQHQQFLLQDAHSIHGNWGRPTQLYQCMADSHGCLAFNCLTSRQLRLLLGGPSPVLADTIARSVNWAEPALLSPTAAAASEALTPLFAPLQNASAVTQEFAALIRAGELEERRLLGVPEDQDPKKVVQEEEGYEVPSKEDLSECTKSGKEPPPDETHLLNLEFDVAIHVRTVLKCFEQVHEMSSASSCHFKDLTDSLSQAYSSPDLGRFVKATDWLCLSSLLLFLQKLKFGVKPGEDQLPPPKSGRLLRFPPKSNEGLLLAKFLKTVSPGNVTGPWSVGDAIRLADSGLPLVLPNAQWAAGDEDEGSGDPISQSTVQDLKQRSDLEDPFDKRHLVSQLLSLQQSRKARKRGTRKAGRLRMFLATDSEVLRPLFVEFLRPFGTVVSSKAGVAHASTVARDKEEEARLQQLNMASFAEFFLLSKAAIAINFAQRPSSFIGQASVYGNTTFIRRGLPYHKDCDCPCCYNVARWGEGFSNDS